MPIPPDHPSNHKPVSEAAKPAMEEGSAADLPTPAARRAASRRAAVEQRQQQADRLRSTLRDLIAERGISFAELARSMGLPTPNLLYNFLKGRSQSLSSATLQSICAALPGITVDDLLGRASGRLEAPKAATVADSAAARPETERTIPRDFVHHIDGALRDLRLELLTVQHVAGRLERSINRTRACFRLLKQHR